MKSRKIQKPPSGLPITETPAADGPWFHREGDSLILEITVQPRASRDEVAGLRGGRLKIRITAPPVDGKANQRILEFLAGEFRVPKNRLTILAGARGRDKRIGIRAPRVLPGWMPVPGDNDTVVR